MDKLDKDVLGEAPVNCASLAKKKNVQPEPNVASPTLVPVAVQEFNG